MPPKKLQSTDYHVAWIAPVSDLELLPSRLMLDEEHDAPDYDTAYDDNVYTCGALAGHNVVIATCAPGMTGNVNAGRVTGSMFKTFSSVRMAVLVGIGGGVPRAEPSDDPTEDVHLGDVVVGWPGDGGPACIYYNSGSWHTDGEFEVLGTINRPDQVLLNALGKLVSDHEMDRSTFDVHRKRLLQSKHKRNSQLVQRPERTEEEATGFIFHRGRIATGNAVVKDGERRDQIRELCNGALCIEMEAAGVDAGRSCLVIRGISDYADSHKDDIWRSYAAGNAAVFARELLGKIPPKNVRNLIIEAKPEAHFLVRFSRNESFVGREEVLGRLLKRLPPIAHPDACQRTVIHGLGGIGKTQVAIEAAYRVRDAYPKCSVFWVPAVNMTMFDNGYRRVGRALEIQGIEDDDADVKALVNAALSRNDAKPWLLIIDNIDDLQLLTDGRLTPHLPFSRKGSILFTTRNRQITAHLQAREASNQNMIAMLSRDFGEQDRYEKTANAIATTWLISFEQIARDAALAASYLRNIAYFAEKDIPISLLPDGREDWDKVEAHEEAEQMHRKTLALREKVLGPEHPSTFDSINNLALVLDS
uniref:Kinesin light chain n=1 Tax=Pyricularia oryzae (strain P131) TaxID=1143193 RepID=L7JCA8_PYRO1